MLERSKISPLGIGTWGLGGYKERDAGVDMEAQSEAIAYTFNQGVTYAETTMWYSQGAAAEILSRGLASSGKRRSDVFISQALYEHDHATVATFSDEVARLHALFETDYSDALTVTMKCFSKFGFEETCMWLESMLASGRARYVSVTNSDKAFLERLHERFGESLFGHELHLNFEIRDMQDLGIIEVADGLGIRNIIAQPLRRNRTATHAWPLLAELAKTYGATQNQVILAWMIGHGYLPLIKSVQEEHIDENIAALELSLSKEDSLRLDTWRPEYVSPRIDWLGTGDGIPADQLANEFDSLYADQHRVQ